MLLHASCVAVGSSAVLLVGHSGIGKSDLALRLIDGGAQLVADDQTLLTRKDETLVASAPTAITGLIEVRHIGLLRMPCIASASVALYVELAPAEDMLERLPEPGCIELLDIKIRRLRLPALAASTPAKIKAALSYPDAS